MWSEPTPVVCLRRPPNLRFKEHRGSRASETPPGVRMFEARETRFDMVILDAAQRCINSVPLNGGMAIRCVEILWNPPLKR